MLARFFRYISCVRLVAPLEERLEKAERELRALDSDQRDLEDRFNRYEGRMKKREAVDKAAPPEEVERPRALGGIGGIRRR